MEEEKFTDNDIAIKIVETCRESEGGVQHDHLSRLLNVSEKKTVEILNQLIRSSYITVKQNADNVPVYHYQDPDVARRFAGLDRETLMIYKLVESSQTMGLTKNDIKNRSGMNPTSLTTILNTLKKRNLIKTEKALNQKNRNVFMLFDLEPGREVRGGSFYKNGEFDQDLVDAISDHIYRYVEKHTETQGSVSKKQIAVSLRSSDFATLDLQDEDIKSILNILVYDDQIEELDGESYRVIDWDDAIKESVLTKTPCGTCPVFNECQEGSVISPEKCIYFLQW